MATTQDPEKLQPEKLQGVAPAGKLRVAVAVGQAISGVWCKRNADGEPIGVTIDLGRAIGARLGLPVELVICDSSAHIVATADDGTWDVTFVPCDAERKKLLAFGPDYFLGTSTYGVHKNDPASDIPGFDRPGCRIGGVEGTATLRSARSTLKLAETIGYAKLADAVAAFRGGEIDGIALGRESLESMVATVPELRVLDGHFHATGTAIAVPHGREVALGPLVEALDELREAGVIAQFLHEHGLPVSAVAPKGSYS